MQSNPQQCIQLNACSAAALSFFQTHIISDNPNAHASCSTHPLPKPPQVEDMLRRSFAEFHAQRAQPGKSAALSAGAAQLDVYRSTPWPDCIRGCDREQLVEYCDITQKITDINEQLQVGAG